MKKVFKRVAVTLLLLALLFVAGSFYLLDYTLRPADLTNRSRNIDSSFQLLTDEYPQAAAWLDSVMTAGALHDMYIEDEAGQNHHALYIPAANPTPNTAVVLHGYTDNSIRMMMIAYMYSRQLGYNVLLPDLYGHGLTDGEMIRMGYLDRLDVLRWIETADELFGSSFSGVRVVVHGISMGAATAMMVSGEVQHGLHQLPYVKCFVADCGYTSVWDQFKSELSAQFNLPAFPLLYISDWLCKVRYGWSFREASPLEAIKRCTLPMLFIHGDTDTFVPTSMVHQLYETKSPPKQLWLAPGVDHAHAYRDYPEEYTEIVKDFLNNYMQ